MYRPFFAFSALAGFVTALSTLCACPEDDCYVVRKCPTSAHGAGGSAGSGGDTQGVGGTANAGGTGGRFNPPPLQPGAIAVGGFHSCVLLDNTVRCWGRNDDGQLGAGSTSGPSGPVTTIGLPGTKELTAGTNFTCALKSSGTVACWGANAQGQLGTGSFSPLAAPNAEVQNLSSVTQINAVSYSACALKSNGSTWCWGDDVDNTLGDEPDQNCDAQLSSCPRARGLRTSCAPTCRLSPTRWHSGSSAPATSSS